MKISASVSMMFRELPLLERFAAAAAAGFDGVEIQVIEEGEPGEMAAATRAAAMPVVLVNLPLGDLLAGGLGLSGVPGREAEFEEAAGRGLRAAKLLDARFVHLGPSRMPPGHERAVCADAYARNVRRSLGIADAIGLEATLLVEPMNRVEMPDALFVSIAEAAAMVAAIDHPRFGLLFDLYHVAMNKEDPREAWDEHGHRAAHVQFSDMPGRHEPGTGTLDIAGGLSHISGKGYPGWYGAEYRPAGKTAAGIAWLDPLRRAVMQDRGAERRPVVSTLAGSTA